MEQSKKCPENMRVSSVPILFLEMEQDFWNRAGAPRNCGKCLFQLFWNKMEQQYLEHVTLPMYPVHKAHRAKRDAGCALTFFSERPQSRFRAQKSPKGNKYLLGLKTS